MPKGLGLRTKLLLGFLFAAAIVALLAVVVVRGNRHLAANAHAMRELHELTMRYHVPRAAMLAEMQLQLTQLKFQLNRVLSNREIAAEIELKDAAIALLLELREYQQAASAAAAFAPALNMTTELVWIEQVHSAVRTLLTNVEVALSRLQLGDQDAALEVYHQRLLPSFAALEQELLLAKSSGLNQQQRAKERIAELLAQALSAVNLVERAVFVALVAALVIALTFAWFYAWRITTPIRRLQQGAMAIGRGDFSQQVVVDSSDEIAELAEAFNRMAKDLHDYTILKELDRLKAEFVATISHELRTPLTSIQGSLKLLQTDAADTLSAEAQDMLQIASRNSERLLRLVNDLLDVQKLEAGMLRLQCERLEANAVAAQAVASMQGFAAQTGTQIRLTTFAEPLWLNADPERLRQILTNLLSNACKYAGPDRQVLLHVRRHMDSVEFAVEDHGLGVPESFRSQLFQKFTQASGSAPGTGLGLNIAKQLAMAHGGDLIYEAILPQGSCFILLLPQARQNASLG